MFFRDILRRLVEHQHGAAVIELGHGIGLDQDRLTDLFILLRVAVSILRPAQGLRSKALKPGVLADPVPGRTAGELFGKLEGKPAGPELDLPAFRNSREGQNELGVGPFQIAVFTVVPVNLEGLFCVRDAGGDGKKTGGKGRNGEQADENCRNQKNSAGLVCTGLFTG